ncbi:MAG: GH3 auxin-responsive promoter family protein [Deltaproteobacteria bacterium]|nr:GH3 auxin-responsive promoter family protein [Deltaproteobacteria bacterium]
MDPAFQAALAANRNAWRLFHEQTGAPKQSQEDVLLRLIRQNQQTAFGHEHGFASIKSIRDYRKQVRIADYERFRSYIDDLKTGAQNILTDEPPLMFTMTSGSTGEPKLIPVTESTRASHAALTQLWYGRAFADHPTCATGKVFGLVGAAEEGRTPGGIPYGAASGLIYRSSPGWIQQAHALPYEIAEIKDFEAKYYVAMRLGLEQNVTFLGTPNPSTILRLVECANRYKQDILKDIHDGSLAARFDIAGDIRAAIASRVSPNRQRALELEALMRGEEGLRPKAYWPNLGLIGCWKGGSVGVRLKEFEMWFGPDMPVRDLGYMASEAQMSLPISDNASAGILAIATNFYEFIPESEMGSAHPVTLTADALEIGVDYYLILTTASGLYRYDINDIVRVTDFYEKTPVIEFLRKGRDVTNITGEKLHVNQVIQALKQAQETSHVSVHRFHASADVAQSRYVFAVETDAAANPQTLLGFIGELDAQLGRLNVEYAQKRQSQRLKPPTLWVMKPGWFERKMAAALQRGARDSQFKAQLLSTTLEPTEEILSVVEAKHSAP